MEEAYNILKISGERIYNVDETGTFIVQSKVPHIKGWKRNDR